VLNILILSCVTDLKSLIIFLFELAKVFETNTSKAQKLGICTSSKYIFLTSKFSNLDSTPSKFSKHNQAASNPALRCLI